MGGSAVQSDYAFRARKSVGLDAGFVIDSPDMNQFTVFDSDGFEEIGIDLNAADVIGI